MEFKDIKNRVGSFLIPKELIESNPEIVMKALSKVLITSAEYKDKDKINCEHIEYTGYSMDFEEIRKNKKKFRINWYTFTIDDNSKNEITFKKVY